MFLEIFILCFKSSITLCLIVLCMSKTPMVWSKGKSASPHPPTNNFRKLKARVSSAPERIWFVNYNFRQQRNSHFLKPTQLYNQVLTFSLYTLYISGRQMNETMASKLIYIPNDDAQNYPFCRLQLVVETFEHST